MRQSALILFVAAGCTFDASGLGETPLTGGGPETSTITTLGSMGGTVDPTTSDATIGVSGSGSMTDSSGGPGGDPTTSPATSMTTTSEPDPTTTEGMTTGEPCEMQWLYPDVDNDTFGDPNNAMTVCVGTPGWVPDNTDCNDMSANAHPGFNEVCDTIDNDCDGKFDEYDKSANSVECLGCKFKIRDSRLYYFCGWDAEWNDAQQFCVNQGFALAKDDNGGEHDWLVQQLGDSGMWWIGANDKGNEGNFTWVSDGSPVPMPAQWGTGEPNNTGWAWQWDVDCAGLLDANGIIAYPGSAGKWNDHDCGEGQKFICEGAEP